MATRREGSATKPKAKAKAKAEVKAKAKKPAAKKTPIQKSTNVPTTTNLNPATSRMRLGRTVMPSISTLQGMIYEEARKELQFPQSMKLYKQMLLDPNIATATGLIEMLIEKVPWKIQVPESAPEEEKERAKKLQWNLSNMERPWEEYIVEILSYIYYGFHVGEKVYTKFTDTPFGAFTGISTLETVSQDTISKWLFERGSGKLLGLRQDLSNILTDLKEHGLSTNKVDLPRKKFTLFRHSVKRNSPEGTSPLKSCYIPWKFRNLIEEYETVGTAKDMGGIPIVGVDVAYLAKAQTDPTSDEAAVVDELKRQAANLHAGEQSYVLIPLAYDQQNNKLFSFELGGINGGGKQYDTDTIVKR